MSESRFHLLILLALSLVLFVFALGSLPLLDTDEGMHAVTSLDMIRSGDWITPTFNGESFFDKPAFFNWFVAASFLLLGFTEFAARLPAAFFGTACVLCAYALGRRMFGARPALLGAIVLATSAEIFVVSRVVVHDISLLTCQTMALTFFYFGVDDERRRRVWFLLFCASCGLAVLAKGPVGALVPGAVLGLFLVLTRRLNVLKSFPWITGITAFLVVAAPWYVLISLRNEDYAQYFLIEKNFGSFSSEDPHHEEPFYYYVLAFTGGFVPWSPFLPASFAHAWRELGTPRRSALIYLLIWFVFTFLFFSAAASKLATYVLLLFPAASLLVGLAWHDLATGAAPRLRRAFTISALVFLVLAAGALIGTVAVRGERIRTDFGVERWQLYVFSGLLVGGWCLSTFALFKNRILVALATNGGTLAAAVLFALMFVAPAIEAQVSSKVMVPELERRLAPDEEIACFRGVIGIGDSALFYTGRRGLDLFNPDALRAYFDTDERRYALVLTKDLDRAEPAADIFHIVHRQPGRVLVSNQPDG